MKFKIKIFNSAKSIITFCSLLFIHFSLLSQTPPPTPMDAAGELKIQLHKVDSILDLKWDKTEYCNTLYSAELFTASSNNGAELLSNSLDNVKANLDAFTAIGVKGVNITINYPILVSSFSGSSDYLAFYKSVLEEIRIRNLKVLITSGFSTTDPYLCRLDVSNFYSGLTIERYKTEKSQMLSAIIDELNPDYLTIEQEPTGINYTSALNISDVDFADCISNFLLNIDKKQTLIGAGTGSWEAFDFIKSIAAFEKLDYLDVHLYPVYYDHMTDAILRIDSIAKSNSKKLIIGSSWAYKTNWEEYNNNNMKPSQIYNSRNCFDTYISVDSAFIRDLNKLSNVIKSEFSSLYYSQSLLGYVHYNKTLYEKMSAGNILSLAKDSTLKDLQQSKLSVNGKLYSNIIKAQCDPNSVNNNINSASSFVNVYPNPSNDLINIEFKSADLKDLTQLKVYVYDVNGRCKKYIDKVKPENNICLIKIEAGSLENGVYFVIMQNSSDNYYRKFIINK